MKTKLLFPLILSLGVFLSFYTSGQIVGDYRSFGAGTNWTTAANWERCAVAGVWPGVASATYPGQNAAVAGTTVTIRNTHTRIIAATIPNSIVNLIIGEGTSGIMSVGAAAGPAVYNLTCTGSVTVSTGGTLNSAGNDVGDFHTLNFQSTLINNGTINFTAATDQITLNVTGTTTNNGTLTFATNLGIKTFNGSVSNTGTWTSTTLANTANLVFRNGVSSTAGTFAAGGATFNTNTPRSIGGTAPISFTGVVTVAAGITITNDNTSTVTMSNAGVGLASGGAGSTFTQGTTGNTLSYAGSSIGVATFNASGAGNTVTYTGASPAILATTYNNLTVNGSGTATVGGATTVNGTMTISSAVTNNNTLTVTTALSGASTLTQGVSSTLNIGGTSTITALTATAADNTVNYTGAGQTVKSTTLNTYYNLGLSGSGNKTFSAATTISGNLSISGTAVANLGAGLTHTANTLTLGAAGQLSGSHGSTGSLATYRNDTYFLNTSNGIVNVTVCSGTTSGTASTYYTRNATLGGNWNDNNSWTTSSDGSGGPLASGEWPRRFDNVVIRAGHTITVDATDDNKSCGISPDGLARTNVGPFTSSNTAMFYQIGDLLIDGTLTVTVEMMIENYTHVTSTGSFTSTTSMVNLGYLEVDNGATFSSLDDMILAGTSTTIVNTNSISTDDLIISFTTATLCGTGTTTLQSGAGSVITYANGATVAQICTSYTVGCTGVGCAGTFPVTGTGTVLLGNTGPGGVGNSTNNKLWLRANDLSLANGAAVDSWSDVSGNALTATNATAGERPTFATNSANGFPSLTFDGTDDNLSLGAAAALNFVPQTNSWSFIIAYRAPANGVSSTPNQGTLFSKAWTTTRNYQYQIDDISGTNSAFASYIGNTLNGGTVVINTNAWVVSSHTNTTTVKSSFSNEAANFTNIAIAAGADASTEVLIGARRNTGPADGTEGFLYTGSIAEIIMFNSVVNAAQRIIVSDYLAAKYAVVLSANDFYTMDDVGNGNFDYEVAGIGQATDGSNHRDAMGTGIVRMWNSNNLGNGEFLIWGHDNTTLYSSTTTGVGAPIQERLSRTWRVSELGGDVGTVSVSFDISSLATPLGSNLRLLIDRDNDGFADNDVTPIAGTFVDNTIVFSGVNFQDDDKFTLGNTDVTSPLPIELISFSAKLSNDIVEVKWSTASELNNDFFTVERAIDLERFEEIENVDGKGTTRDESHYKTIDPTPPYGRSYYRLKQTDFDGKFAYSDLEVVDYKGPRFPALKVYPNPSKGYSFTIQVNGLKDQATVPVQIYNGQGQKVYEHVFEVSTPGTLKHDFEFGSPLRQGLYIIKAGQTLQLTQKILVD